MKRKFLLDTNTVSALTQKHADHHATIALKASTLGNDDEMYISIVTIYEMEYGAVHAQNSKTAQEMWTAIEVVKNSFVILGLTTNEAKIFAQLKERYRQSTGIGKKALIKHNIDFMIAATAIENKAIIVSNDWKMFSTIQKFQSDFQWEDWTQ
jgi:predicted nucleic acid-binding protein